MSASSRSAWVTSRIRIRFLCDRCRRAVSRPLIQLNARPRSESASWCLDRGILYFLISIVWFVGHQPGGDASRLNAQRQTPPEGCCGRGQLFTTCRRSVCSIRSGWLLPAQLLAGPPNPAPRWLLPPYYYGNGRNFFQPIDKACERALADGNGFFGWGFRMGSLQERITACANASANLLAQLTELDELREQVRKAELSPAIRKRPLKRPASVDRRVLAPRDGSR